MNKWHQEDSTLASAEILLEMDGSARSIVSVEVPDLTQRLQRGSYQMYRYFKEGKNCLFFFYVSQPVLRDFLLFSDNMQMMPW